MAYSPGVGWHPRDLIYLSISIELPIQAYPSLSSDYYTL